MKANYKRASKGTVFKYSLGGAAIGIPENLIVVYLTFFWTDIFGISPYAVAGLMIVSRVIDAVTDPLMGVIADRTRSRFGKYRPWIIFGAPIEGLIVFMLFSTPCLTSTMKLVYVYVAYIGFSILSTIVGIPYYSLMPLLTKEPYQRTIIIACKSVILQSGKLFITVLALPLVEVFGGGTRGWSCLGAFVGVILTILFWIVAWGMKTYDSSNINIAKNANERSSKEKKANLGRELLNLAKVKPMIVLMTSFGLLMASSAIFNSVNLYYFKYVLNREDLVPIVTAVNMITGVLAVTISPQLVKRFGKKKLYVFGCLGAVCLLVPLVLNPTPPIAILMLLLSVLGFMSMLPECLAWSMLPDCIDYAEWKFDLKANGLLSSTFTFTAKLGIAFGGFFSSFLLGVVGFVANQAQTQDVIRAIVFLRYGIPIFVYALSMIFLHFYDITPEKYEQIVSELEAKKSENA